MTENTHSRALNILKVSVLLNVLLILSLGVIYIRHNETKPEYDIQEDENMVCIPQDKEDMIQSCKDKRTAATGQDICCYQDTAILKMVLKMIEAQKHMKKEVHSGDTKYMPWWTGRKYSAHLYGLPSKYQDGDLVWTTHDTLGTAYINSLKVHGNGIQTQSVGVYVVYAAFTLTLNNTRQVPAGYLRIVLTEPTGGATILAEKAFGDFVHDSNKFSKFIDGRFKLLSGQMVGVEVYSDNKISFDISPYANYFGMYKVL